MMETIDDVRTKLKKLENTKQKLDGLVMEQKNLVERLNSGKPRLKKIKDVYDKEVLPFVDTMLKLDEIQVEISKLDRLLGTQTNRVGISNYYGYVGLLHDNSKDVVIHESIAPAVLGDQLWVLLRERIANGRK